MQESKHIHSQTLPFFILTICPDFIRSLSSMMSLLMIIDERETRIFVTTTGTYVSRHVGHLDCLHVTSTIDSLITLYSYYDFKINETICYRC